MSFCLVRCRYVSTLDLSSSKSSEDHLYPAWAYFPNLWFTLRVTVPHCAHSLSPDSSIHYAMNVPLNQRRVWPVFVVFPSGLNQVLVDEIWVVVGGIAVKLDFGIPACVSSPIWCAICSFMLAMVVIAFASSSSFDAGWCYKCCSLGLACLVLTDMSSLHFLHWFDCLIVSASVWNSNTCFFVVGHVARSLRVWHGQETGQCGPDSYSGICCSFFHCLSTVVSNAVYFCP